MKSPKNKKALQWLGISAGCLLAYAGMRSLPVEPCDFLHYGEFVNADGIIEGCGYEETDFFDMQALRFPILVKMVPQDTPRVGEEVTFDLSIQTTTGRPISYHDIAVTHTERLHLLLVDPSLRDYQHIHPRPAGPPGHYTFTMTPQSAGEYRAYFDFIPLTNARRTLLHSHFHVEGEGKSSIERPELAHNWRDWRFELTFKSGQPVVDKEFEIELQVTEGEGRPRFEPVMGAFAHLVAFDAAGRGFSHLHPMNPFIDKQDPYNPEMRFRMRLNQPGHYRIWAQIKVEGEELYLPFDLHIAS